MQAKKAHEEQILAYRGSEIYIYIYIGMGGGFDPTSPTLLYITFNLPFSPSSFVFHSHFPISLILFPSFHEF
jgi:hypothetical protein